MHLFMSALSYGFQQTLLRQWRDIFHSAYIAEAVARLIKSYEIKVSSPRSSTESSAPAVPVST